jgi:hypothetical protein
MSKPRRLGLILPWAAFALIVIGWMIYWFIVAGAADQRLAQWAAEQRAAGGQASYARVVRHGFPVLLRLEIQDLLYAPARGGWRASTARADLHVNLLNTGHVSLEAKAPLAITRENGAITNITANALIASLRMRGDDLAQAGVEADALILDDPAKDGVLRVEKFVFNVRPDPRAAGEYQIALDATALTLPRAVRSFESFGLDIPALRAAIVIEHGAALLDSAPDDPLGPWREAGGRARFEALALNWGPLEATGQGHGGLDDQRRIAGALALAIPRPAPVLAALARSDDISSDAREALGVMALGFALSGDDVNFDIEARDGTLRIEGLTVRPLPPVY